LTLQSPVSTLQVTVPQCIPSLATLQLPGLALVAYGPNSSSSLCRVWASGVAKPTGPASWPNHTCSSHACKPDCLEIHKALACVMQTAAESNSPSKPTFHTRRRKTA
jgi:hypothetical protein